MIDSIIKGFDVWTDAQGVKSKGRVKSIDNISLEGIARLRELILDFAIRGKLVPQEENDEPANELLERIKIEKNRLINEKGIGKTGNFNDIDDDKIPFNLPQGWKWTNIRNVGHDWGQMTPTNDFTYIDVSAINNALGVISEPTILKASEAPSRARKIVKKGTVIYSTVRPYLKNICVINEDYEPQPIASTAFAIIHPYLDMPSRYFYYFFRSPFFISYVESVQTGIAYPAINDKQFFEALIPLPPIEEQKRIIEKIDELMSICDNLEEEQTKNLTTHHHLVKCLLETLTQAKDADTFESSWEKISQNFDILFCTEDSIEQLKQTILQLAAMGKLTKQEPNDELGNDVLKLVFKEKEKLAEKGIIKKPNKSFKISDDEKPFNIPEKWAWARLSDTGIASTGKTPSTSVSKFFGGDIPFIGPGQITENGAISDSDKTLTEEGSGYSTIANTGDIIMVCIGGSIGKCAIINSKITFNQQLNCISPLIFDSKFLYNTFNAPFFKEQILKKATGSATPIINRGKWEEIVIPVPSISEQQRIVSRINELFGICDLIKERIKQGQMIQKLLSSTIID